MLEYLNKPTIYLQIDDDTPQHCVFDHSTRKSKTMLLDSRAKGFPVIPCYTFGKPFNWVVSVIMSQSLEAQPSILSQIIMLT